MALGIQLEALKGNKEITDIEISEANLQKLKAEIIACSPEQSAECIQILDEAIPRAIGNAKIGLQGLRDSLETQGTIEYSIDGLIEHVSEDKKAKAFLELYKSVIANDLTNIYGEKYNILSNSAKNTIQLVFWNIIQGQLGMKGVINMGKGMVGNLSEGLTGLFGETDEETTGSILTKSLRAKEDTMSKLAEAPGMPEGLKDDLSQVIDIVESIIGKEADNFNVLLDATIGMGESEKAQIFENPLIVQAVMKEGKYKDKNFNIDLTTSPPTITLGDTQNIIAVQSAFLTEMKEDTSKLGGKMDKLRGLKEKADKILGKFGVTGGLNGLFESLYNVPVIGIFFKMIFGDFFSTFDKIQGTEAVERVIDALGNIPAALSLKSLQDTFLPKFSEKYKDKENTALGKLFSKTPPLSEKFYKSLSGEGEFFSVLTEAQISFGGSDFWDQVFMGQGTTPQTSLIHNKLLSLRILENGEVTEEQIIAALNSLTVAELSVPDTTQGTPIPASSNIPPEDFIGPRLPVSLESQIAAISGLPASLTSESGEKIEISAFDATKSSIIVNTKTYTISLTAGFGQNIDLKDFTINTGTGKISYINPTDKSEKTVEIDSLFIKKMLSSLLKTEKFSEAGTTSKGIPFVLDIK